MPHSSDVGHHKGIVMPELKDFLAAVVTLLATFVGAWAAFAFERGRRRDEQEVRNVGAANRALYTLFNIWNVLEQFRKTVIEPYRGKHDAWLNMAATFPSKTGLATFEAGELAYLLQTPHATVYATLMLEEQRFAFAVSLIEMRSSLVLNEVFRALGQAQVTVGTPLPEADVERIIGIDTTRKLKVVTDSLIKNIDEDLLSIVAAYDELQKFMKIIYPERKLIRVQFELEAAK